MIDENDTNKRIVSLKTDLENYIKIVDTFDKPIYKDLIKNIQNIKSQINRIVESKSRYESYTSNFNEIIGSYGYIEVLEPLNLYDIRLKKIINNFDDILNQEFDFLSTDLELDRLNESLVEQQNVLNEYLTTQGLSQDNISEYEKAVNKIPFLKDKIKEAEIELIQIKKQIFEFVEDSKLFKIHKSEFEAEIISTLGRLNENLKSTNENVADISFEYEFNQEGAKERLFVEFEKFFEFNSSQSSTKRESVKEYLFCIEPSSVSSLHEYLKELDKRGETNAKQYLKELLGTKLILKFINC